MATNTYLRGAYAEITDMPNRASDNTSAAPVYIGTAPVFMSASGGADVVNVPVLVRSFAEAVDKFGYSEDWATFTLCEAMYAHFIHAGVGPIVLINVLDPATDVTAASAGTLTIDLGAGRRSGILADAVNGFVDAISAKTTGDGAWTLALREGDYDAVVDTATNVITVAINQKGIEYIKTTKSLTALTGVTVEATIKKRTVAAIAAARVVGATDGEGTNTGVYAVKSVYQATGKIPDTVLAPGWGEIKEVHDALRDVTENINGHWKAIFYTDIPVLNGSTQMTISGASTWKTANGYNAEHEKTFFPRFQTADGKVFHLSTLYCAAKAKVDAGNSGVPYMTASNTEIKNARRLYFGANQSDNLFIDAETLNDKLCKHGITTAAYVGGKWVLWGAHTANYEFGAGDMDEAVSDTTRMMLNYICNSFQQRRAETVDLPMSRAKLSAIQFEEQTMIDALVNMGALLYGKVTLLTGVNDYNDIINGDFKFKIEVTTTPLAKSLTAYVMWTDVGIYSLIGEEVAE